MISNGMFIMKLNYLKLWLITNQQVRTNISIIKIIKIYFDSFYLTDIKRINLTLKFLFVGVNKHFQMALIVSKLQDYFDISSDKIWAHLDTMYNMESLDDMDSLPFPNDEQDFYLPDNEFGNLKAKKEEKVEDKKTNVLKKNDTRETAIKQINKDLKKDDKTKIIDKKETIEKQLNVAQRRDSRDGKEPKTPISVNKKDIRKGKTPLTGGSLHKEDDKNKSKLEPVRTNKRPTRGSMRPDEITNSGPGLRKSQSPLTITSNTANKRRRI